MKILILLFTVTIGVLAVDFPSDIKMCDRSQPKFKECMFEMVETLRPYFKTGFPSAGIPPVDPMKFSQVFFKLNTFNVTARNIEVFGASNVVVKDLDMLTDKNVIHIKLYLDHASAKADYHIAGKLVLIDLNADGSGKFDFGDVNADVVIKTKKVKRDGKEYIEFVDLSSDVVIKSIKVDLDKLFGDNVELTRNTNKLINENIDEFAKEFHPLVSELIGGFIMQIFKPVFTNHSLDVLKYFN